jgi:hypothetical protein
MKTHPALKPLLILTAACILAAPLFAAEGDTGAAKKEKKEPQVTAEVLKKYDVNKDGKLDATEEAAWKADLAKAKAEKKAEKKEEKKQEKTS